MVVKKARRPRADSKESAVTTFVAAARRKIVPPDDMTMDRTDKRIFDEIINEFAKVDWTAHSIRVAALLARTIHDMQDDQEDLRTEGSVSVNGNGNPVMNPRRTACQGYASQINQMRRTLALHATAGSSKRDVGKRRTIHRDQEADSPLHHEDDDLISLPRNSLGNA